MAPHSSTLAWKIPWTEEPGRLQSMRSRRVGHDWVTSLSLFTFMHWRKTWQPTPVFLPGESQRRGSLVGCCLWGRIESDTTEVTYHSTPYLLWSRITWDHSPRSTWPLEKMSERNCSFAVVERPELGAYKGSASEQSHLGPSFEWKPWHKGTELI